MRVKQRQLNVFYIIQVSPIRLVRSTKGTPLLTIWHRNVKEGLPLPPLPSPVNGTSIVSILLILRAILTLTLKLTVHCAYLMVRFSLSRVLLVSNLSLKRIGVWLTVTMSLALFSLTSWIVQVQILNMLSAL